MRGDRVISIQKDELNGTGPHPNPLPQAGEGEADCFEASGDAELLLQVG